MADSKLTGLSARGTYVTGDLLYVVPSGGAAQYQGTINNLAAYVASNAAAVSGVAAAFNSTSAGLTISTITSGTLAITSSGLLTLTGVGASVWTPGAGATIVSDGTTGIKIGTATSQKIGFFNVTPVVQEAGSNDVLGSLVTLGLRATSSNPPLNLGSGVLTAGTSTLGATTGTSFTATGGIHTSSAGVLTALSTTAAAQTASAVAGVGLTITADPAVAGNVNNGAAAGGGISITAGAAARLVSGTANGGSITLTPGAGTSGGSAGQIVLSSAGSGTVPGVTLGGSTTGLSFNSNSIHIVTGSASTCNFAFDVAGQVKVIGAGSYAFAPSTNLATAADASLNRVAASVLGATSWIQNTGGHKKLDANATSTSDTLANTNLAWTLIAGRSYSVKLLISGGDSTATEGIQVALTASGGLTATTFNLSAIGTNGTVVAGTTRVTALGSAIDYTTFTATSDIFLIGEIKVNAAGTANLQIATKSHAVGTLTVNAGTWGEFNDLVAL